MQKVKNEPYRLEIKSNTQFLVHWAQVIKASEKAFSSSVYLVNERL